MDRSLDRLRGLLGRRGAAATRPGGAAAGGPAPGTPATAVEYPPLAAEHVAGARLYATREDMIVDLAGGRAGVVAEVGVALGDFSDFILRNLQPSKFVAIDLFDLHRSPNAVFRGRTMASVMGEMTHGDYYRARFAEHSDRLVVEVGLSWERLAGHPDASFDLIYLDAAHDYDSVARDTEVAVAKLAPEGLLVFNDYIVFDHIHDTPYGVVPNVNRLVVEDGWRVAGFALQRQLFCDIAVRRA